MRTINATAAAQFGGPMALAVLVELELTAPIRLALCRDDIRWGEKLFVGGKMASLEPIKDQGGEVQGQTFTLGGVQPEHLSLALTEPVQGKRARVWVALLHADTLELLDVVQVWSGTCDQTPIKPGGANATVSVTAEHRGVTFARPKGLRYTDHDQRKLFPGDRSLEFIVAQSTHQDVWPAAAWFRK